MGKGGAIRLSQEAVDAHQAKVRAGRESAAALLTVAGPNPAGVTITDVAISSGPQGGLQRFQAIGRAPAKKLNKTEQEWADILEQKRAAGEILWWKAHPFNVRLADDTFYRIDFLVLRSDMVLEIHETKGEYVTDKGQMKIKLCAEVLPVFVMVKMTKQSKKNGGGWKREEF
jgi:hypothetical protein